MCIRDRSTSASRAAASIRLAPSATSSSSVVDSSASADVSTCTLSIGVPSSPAFHRQRLLVLFKEEGTSRPRSGGASTSSGYISIAFCLVRLHLRHVESVTCPLQKCRHRPQWSRQSPPFGVEQRVTVPLDIVYPLIHGHHVLMLQLLNIKLLVTVPLDLPCPLLHGLYRLVQLPTLLVEGSLYPRVTHQTSDGRCAPRRQKQRFRIQGLEELLVGGIPLLRGHLGCRRSLTLPSVVDGGDRSAVDNPDDESSTE